MAKPGPQPGTHHRGTFKPGPDPRRNYNGRPKKPQEFEDLVKRHSVEALNTLVDCLNDRKAHWRDKRASAEVLLNHAWGTPVQRHLMAEVKQSTRDLNINDLRERVALLIEQSDSECDSDAIDVEFTEVGDGLNIRSNND